MNTDVQRGPTASTMEQRIENIERMMRFNKPMLTVEDVAALLELSVGRVQHLMSDKQIPYYRTKQNSKRVYFDRDEIVDWMRGQRIATDAEIEEQTNRYVARKRAERA